jgi:hypothetical protein
MTRVEVAGASTDTHSAATAARLRRLVDGILLLLMSWTLPFFSSCA